MIKLSNILILLLISCSAHAQFLTDSIIARGYAAPNTVLNIDLDQDGLKDIIVLAQDHSSVYWYKNEGNGHFADKVRLIEFGRFFEGRFLNFEDFDQDGDYDFCFYGLLPGTTSDYKFMFYKNEGNLQFTSTGTSLGTFMTTNPVAKYTLAFDDLDGDGLKDLVFPGNNYGVHYRNMGNFQFQFVSTVSTSCINAKIVDLNNDGQNDILTTGSGYFRVNLNNGTGVFSQSNQVQYGTPNGSGNSIDFEVYDYDQDGDKDLIYLNNSSDVYSVHSIKVYLNNGSGVFGAPTTLFTSTGNTEYIDRLIATNLDGDNIPDLLFYRVNTSGTSLYTVYYRPSAGGSFQNSGLSFEIGNSRLFGIIDVNGDNLSELFATKISPAHDKEDLLILSASTPYSFVVSEVLDSFYSLGSNDYFNIGDLNSDGKADILAYPSSRIYSDTSEMISVSTLLPTNSPIGYKLADLNGDNAEDIVGNQYNGIVYRLNNGDGTFANPVLITLTGLSYSGIRRLAIKDYDGDGDPDILFTTENPNLAVWVILNMGGLNFSYVSPYILFDEVGSGLSLSNPTNLELPEGLISAPNDLSLAILSDNRSKLSCAFQGASTPYLIFESATTNALNDVRIMDVDEDGLKDLVFISSGVVVWMKNLGNMSFGSPVPFYTAGIATQMLLTDYDLDGDKDIIVSSDQQISRISILENLSFGNFADENIIISIPEPFDGNTELRSGDYEGDGDQDLFVYQGNQNNVFILRSILNNSTAIEGIVYYDQNQNQVQDSNEQGLVNIPVQMTGTGTSGTSTNISGDYTLNAFNGAHTVTALGGSNWSLTTDSTSYQVNVQTPGQQIDSLNFGFFPTQLIDSAIVTLVGGFPRCNSVVNHWINTKNTGTLEQDGIVSMQMDSAVSFVSSNPAPDSISNGIYYWHYDDLVINDFNRINVHLQFPPFTSMGNNIVSYVNTYVLDQSGVVLDTVSDTLSQILVCGYDPNDKVVSPVGYEEEGYITTENEWLEYTIRFQNTGNDTVFNVRIIDQISELLDISTFELLGASHPVISNVLQTRKLEFKLNNILLPDSGANFLGSQGYVVFRMKQNPNLAHGQEIKNKASIFFDLNPPIITNTVLNTIYECSEEYVMSIVNGSTCITNNVEAEVIEYSSLDTYEWSISGVANSGGLNFSWPSDSSGVFDLTLSVTNPLCQQIDSTLPVTIYPSYSFIADTLQICQGDSILVHGNYEHITAVYSNQLNTAFGCDSIVGIYLNVNMPASVILSDYPQNTICLQSGTVSVPAGLPSGGNYSGTGISGGVFDPSDAGVGNHMTYYTYVDANDCLSIDSVSLSVEDCLGVEELKNSAFTVYPNPARESVHVVRANEGCFHVRLLSLLGEVLVSKQNICSDSYTIDLQTISKGTYLIEVLDEESNKKELFEVIID